jgi:hypothetical protein
VSVEAITWALRQPVEASSAKFVLVVLANCASADGALAFPSVAYLAESTGQDRKTVVTNLKRLVEWGLIEDTGERSGRTKQVVVYRLKCAPSLFESHPKTEPLQGTQRSPKPEQFQNRNSSAFPPKESRFSSETIPKTGHGTVNNPKEPSAPPADAGEREPPAPPPTEPTPAAQACRRMRAAGCIQVNPGHPHLLAALAEGVTPQTLGDTAAEAVAAGKTNPFVWAIATARGRHAEGAKPVTTTGTHRHASDQPRESLVDRAASRAARIFAEHGFDTAT